jgi:hypothetical protein
MHIKRAIDWKKLGAALLNPSGIAGDTGKSPAPNIQKTAPTAPKPATKPDTRMQTPSPVLQSATPPIPEPDMQNQPMGGARAGNMFGKPGLLADQKYVDQYIKDLYDAHAMTLAGADPYPDDDDEDHPELYKRLVEIQKRTEDVLRSIGPNMSQEELANMMRIVSALGDMNREIYSNRGLQAPPPNADPRLLEEKLLDIWTGIESLKPTSARRNIRNIIGRPLLRDLFPQED